MTFCEQSEFIAEILCRFFFRTGFAVVLEYRFRNVIQLYANPLMNDSYYAVHSTTKNHWDSNLNNYLPIINHWFATIKRGRIMSLLLGRATTSL